MFLLMFGIRENGKCGEENGRLGEDLSRSLRPYVARRLSAFQYATGNSFVKDYFLA